MRKTVVRQSDGFVENIIELEDGANWQPPAGHALIDVGNGSPGDNWDGTNFIKPEPVIPEPPRSGHPAQLVSVNATARPARVKRMWSGEKYFYDCLATETVITEYQAGKIVIGDYLWVEFLDPSEDIGGGEQIVIGKVRKTW